MADQTGKTEVSEGVVEKWRGLAGTERDKFVVERDDLRALFAHVDEMETKLADAERSRDEVMTGVKKLALEYDSQHPGETVTEHLMTIRYVIRFAADEVGALKEGCDELRAELQDREASVRVLVAIVDQLQTNNRGGCYVELAENAVLDEALAGVRKWLVKEGA